jgi:TolB-like protein/Tfp pilus assembly protein PilF
MNFSGGGNRKRPGADQIDHQRNAHCWHFFVQPLLLAVTADQKSQTLSLFNELKRRNVFRIAAAYVVGAWLLIQVTETIFPLFGFGDTPARLVVIVLAIGFIPSLILSWVFELTPEGLKKDADVDSEKSISQTTSKKLDRIVLVVLVLALGYFAFDKFVLNPQREATQQQQQDKQLVTVAEESRQEGRIEALVESYGDKSIAVLAFVDMSPEGDQAYFSDGIAEELLNLLAKIPELRVISRSSAFSYKGKDVNLAQIAQELNVAHILEGSVRKSGNRLRITAQLIEALSDTHLWSQTYDRSLDNIFVIQDEIAATVVEQLKITLLGAAPEVQEVDPQAYAFYLQARHLGRQSTPEGWEQSNALHEQALAIDPNYAAAWSGLAGNYAAQAGRGLLPFEEGSSLAHEAAEKALAIDPDYALAHSNLGWIAMIYDSDPAAAARYYERALALEPANINIIVKAANLLQNVGRLEQAIALNEYAIARDPVNPVGHANLSLCYLYAGRWDEAIASAQTALRMSPGYIGGHYTAGIALLLKGESQAALAAIQNEEFEAFRLIGLVMTHHALGDTSASDTMLKELIEKFETEWAYNIAYVLAFRSEADRAFEWLDKAVEYGDPGLSVIVGDPNFTNIQDDPRWLLFLESIGKAPQQLASIEFEVTLPK